MTAPGERSQLPPECACAIGRAREIAELESLLLDGALATPPVVVLHGRRGIGKTTVAAALALRATAHRSDVVWAAQSSLREVPAGSLVILDDAGEVDPAKLERLAELLRPGSAVRLLVVCRGARYRLQPQLAAWLDRFQAAQRCRFLMLRPLQSGPTEELVRAACGGRVSRQTIAEIARRTAGDPSLIKEFARLFRRDPEQDLSVEVPETVTGLVALRLAVLGQQQRRVVEAASLFAGAFSVDWLAPVVEQLEPVVLEALRCAEDAGLVEQSGDDRFEISAPVVREAIQSLVFGGELQLAHRRLADALIELPPGSGSTLAEETARQYHSSRQLPGADRGVEPALQAAGHALAASHPLRAAELLEIGLELCGRDRQATQARLTSALARALASALCHADAVAALEQACRRMRAAGIDSLQIAELVREVGCGLPLGIASVDPAAAERIRCLVGELDERSGERLASVLSARRPQMTSPAQLRERLARISTVGEGAPRTAAVFRAAAETIEVLLDPTVTGLLLQQTREQAERLDSNAARSLACSVRAVAAARAGDLPTARGLAAAAVEAQPRSGRALPEPPLAQVVQLLTEMQLEPDWEALAERAADLAADHWSSPYGVTLTALTALARARAGDTTGARVALLDVLAALRLVRGYASAANAALGPAAEAAWRLGDTQIGEQLLPVVMRLREAGGGDFYMYQHDLTTARLALLLGRSEEARAAYERARLALDSARERTLRAAVEHEYQQVLAVHEQQPQALPDGLTGRQLEVLLLLSEGLTNQQIAERLVLSVNTVNRHVADIYRKIDACNRVGAAAYVARHGLAR